MQEIRVLKVGFDKVTLKDAIKKVIGWIDDNKKHYIVTPNPEILLKAQSNNKYLKVLNNADLSIADGTGILWATTYLRDSKELGSSISKVFTFIKTLIFAAINPNSIRKILPERVTGIDLMRGICKHAKKTPIFLLGAKQNVAEIAAEKLRKKYHNINIVGTFSGSAKVKDEAEIVKIINSKQPNILFIAYGAPDQELWIARNIKKLQSVKIIMGVGGAFDFISENKKRAPKIMQKTGIEWLYRVIQEPSRIKRIYTATILFPKAVLKKTIQKPKISSIVSW